MCRRCFERQAAASIRFDEHKIILLSERIRMLHRLELSMLCRPSNASQIFGSVSQNGIIRVVVVITVRLPRCANSIPIVSMLLVFPPPPTNAVIGAGTMASVKQEISLKSGK